VAPQKIYTPQVHCRDRATFREIYYFLLNQWLIGGLFTKPQKDPTRFAFCELLCESDLWCFFYFLEEGEAMLETLSKP